MSDPSRSTPRLAYEDRGEGNDVILFIHGHPFNRTMWADAVQAAVAAGWRAVVPDLTGYGDSEARPGRVTLEDFGRELIGLLDELGIGSVAVCGLSMGGQIAMALCDLYPGRVRGVVLAATFARAETEEGRSARLGLADRLEAEGMTTYADHTLPFMLSAAAIETRPETALAVLGMMRATSPVGAAAALRGRADRKDYIETLRAFDGPALIVAGDQDAFTTRADADAMMEALADARLLWLPGVGHMPNLEDPDSFNAALTGFLAVLNPGAGQ